MADDELLDPRDIESLLDEQGEGADPPPAEGAPSADTPDADSGQPGDLLSPNEIEALLQMHGVGASHPAIHGRGADSGDVRSPGSSAEALIDQAEADLLEALSSQSPQSPHGGLRRPGDPDISAAEPLQLSNFDSSSPGYRFTTDLKALEDVELDLRIELGRAELLIEEVLELRSGSVVPLDKLAGDPVDILVNGRLVARGEVLVLNNNFCVRVAEIMTPDL
ncbi:MAG: flagellar motor switch protein FliN [Planctomycetaceae bacterium]|nr:flagellar motor switch protein FliN [Planctomycetaceae bacterium]